VFGESLPSRFSRSSTTLMRDGKVPVASSKGRPNRTLMICRSSIVWCESARRSDPTRISDVRDLACRSASDHADAQLGLARISAQLGCFSLASSPQSARI
jgi:hypothetical protein